MDSENIYNLIVPLKKNLPPPKPRFKCSIDPKLPPTASTFGQRSRTEPKVVNISGNTQSSNKYTKSGIVLKRPLGGAKEMPDKNKPATAKQEFLRRKSTGYRTTKPSDETENEGHKLFAMECLDNYNKTNVINDNPRSKIKTKPAVPSVNEKLDLQPHVDKDFITINILDAVLMEPKNVKVPEPRAYEREDYGKVPAYLSDVKQQIQEEMEYIKQVTEAENESRARSQGELTYLPEEERLEILSQLKARYELKQREYQTMTHQGRPDTLVKLTRKQNLEADLGQLDLDIEAMSKENILIDPNA